MEYAVTENRMTQMLREHINEQMPDTIPKVARTKDFVDRVAADVFKEETEALTRAGLTPADVTGGINRIARGFYIETCKRAENWPI